MVTSARGIRRRRSVDVLLELYVCWREECHGVEQAYEWWARSDRGRRELAYAAYFAALDREELAAGTYARQIERVSRAYA